MKQLQRLLRSIVLGLTIFLLPSVIAFAQNDNLVAVTVNCDSITVQFKSNSFETAFAEIDVRDSARVASILPSTLNVPVGFSIAPGGVNQATIAFPTQPNGTLLYYSVRVTTPTQTLAIRADESNCVNFYNGAKLNELEGPRPIAIYCTSAGGVNVIRVDSKTGAGVETLTASAAQIAQALVNAQATGANQPAASTASGISLWALTTSELQAVYRSIYGNYDFIFPVTTCGGVSLVGFTPTVAQTTTTTSSNANVFVPSQTLYVPATNNAGQTVLIPAQTSPVTTVTSSTAGCSAPAGYRYAHVVQVGQNLFRIGLYYGVPYTTIAQVNGITNVNSIYVGQCLIVP